MTREHVPLVATILAAIATFISAICAYKQTRIAESHLAMAGTQGKIAASQASSAYAQALMAKRQTEIAERQTQLTEKYLTMVRQQTKYLEASVRGKVAVYDLVIDTKSIPRMLTLNMKNLGRGTVMLRELAFVFLTDGEDGRVMRPKVSGMVLTPNQSREMNIQIPSELTKVIAEEDLKKIMQSDQFFVTIEYVDAATEKEYKDVFRSIDCKEGIWWWERLMRHAGE